MSGHEERAAVASMLAFLTLAGLGVVMVAALCLVSVSDGMAAGAASGASSAACLGDDEDEA